MASVLSVATLLLAGARMATAETTDTTDMPAAEGPAAPCVSLVEAIQQNGLNRLGEAVLSFVEDPDAATLIEVGTATEELPEEQKITLFAPEDAAFPAPEELPEGSVLLDILLGHVVPSFLPSPVVADALSGGEDVTLDSLGMSPVVASLDGDDIFIAAEGQEEPAQVVKVDIFTCSGVIHVIDAILLAGDAEAPGMAPAPAPGAEAPGAVDDDEVEDGTVDDEDDVIEDGTDTSTRGTETEEEEESSSASALFAGVAVTMSAALFALL